MTRVRDNLRRHEQQFYRIRAHLVPRFKELESYGAEWKVIFVSAFPSQVDYAGLLRKIFDKKKLLGKELLNYYYEKLALPTAAEIDGKKAVNLF